jgi:hypothetical protein
MNNIPKSKEETIEMLSEILEMKKEYIELMEESFNLEELSLLSQDDKYSIKAEIELNKIEFSAMVYALAHLKGVTTIPDIPKAKGKPKLHLVN